MPTMRDLAFEAMCSALYNMPFTKFLGERPDPDDGHEVAWFRLSPNLDDVSARTNPKQVVVAIRKSEDDLVVVQASWINPTNGFDHPIRGEQRMRVSTVGSQPDVMVATEQAVAKVLDIYADVLTEEGVAGPLLSVAPESEAGDPDDPDDMAVPLEDNDPRLPE